MIKLMRQFRLNERGAAGIEYAIIAAFISLAIISGITISGNETSASFTNAADGLRSATP